MQNNTTQTNTGIRGGGKSMTRRVQVSFDESRILRYEALGWKTPLMDKVRAVFDDWCEVQERTKDPGLDMFQKKKVIKFE